MDTANPFSSTSVERRQGHGESILGSGGRNTSGTLAVYPRLRRYIDRRPGNGESIVSLDMVPGNGDSIVSLDVVPIPPEFCRPEVLLLPSDIYEGERGIPQP